MLRNFLNHLWHHLGNVATRAGINYAFVDYFHLRVNKHLMCYERLKRRDVVCRRIQDS